MLHHLARPWRESNLLSRYYFCDDPACEVVYFDEGGRSFEASSLRTEVGLKARTPGATLCYCFGVTYADAAADPTIRDFVVRETRDRSCACEIRNPSGACCLKGFPREP